jgi:hypothetical protein
MNRREALVSLSLAGLSVAFAVVAALVFLTGGRPSLVRRKLKLGTAILTLTTALAGCGETEVTCYAPPLPPNTMEIPDYDQQLGGIPLNLAENNVLHGRISARQGETFSSCLVSTIETNETVLQRGAIVAQDGAFDESTEEFEIAIRTDLATGAYRLRLYARDEDSQDAASAAEYLLIVTNE